MSFTILYNEKTLFQAIKKKIQKVKNLTFFQRGNPWFWSKNGHFSKLFFLAIQARKMHFTIFYNERTPFYAIKTRRSRSRKIDIFPKGLTHGFGPKNAIFPNFFFLAIQGRKMPFTIFYNARTPFYAIKTRCSRSRKIDIFPKGLTHGFGPKNAIFPNFFFLAIQGRKMPFTIFYNARTPFYAIKTRCSRSRKIDIFPKGLTHGFGPKNAIFPNFFFLAIQGRKMPFTIFYNGRTPFYAIKTRR